MYLVGQKIRIKNIPDTSYNNLNVAAIIIAIPRKSDYDYSVEIKANKEGCGGLWGIYASDIITSRLNYND